MRILVTGSRDWASIEFVCLAIAAVLPEGPVTIVHGACPSGADLYADQFAKSIGLDVEPHPAEWDKYGKSAGFRRNQEMVDLGADICLAFIRDGSKGATHTANAAEKAGIKTIRFTDPPTEEGDKR